MAIPPPVFRTLSPPTYSGTVLLMVTSLLTFIHLLSTQVFPSAFSIHINPPFWKEIQPKTLPQALTPLPPALLLHPCLSHSSGKGCMDMPPPALCPSHFSLLLVTIITGLAKVTIDLNPFSGTAQQHLALLPSL